MVWITDLTRRSTRKVCGGLYTLRGTRRPCPMSLQLQVANSLPVRPAFLEGRTSNSGLPKFWESPRGFVAAAAADVAGDVDVDADAAVARGAQIAPDNVAKWFQHDCRRIPNLFQHESKMVLKWIHNDATQFKHYSTMISEWFQTNSTMISKWFQNDSKMISKLF